MGNEFFNQSQQSLITCTWYLWELPANIRLGFFFLLEVLNLNFWNGIIIKRGWVISYTSALLFARYPVTPSVCTAKNFCFCITKPLVFESFQITVNQGKMWRSIRSPQLSALHHHRRPSPSLQELAAPHRLTLLCQVHSLCGYKC